MSELKVDNVATMENGSRVDSDKEYKTKLWLYRVA